MAQSVERLTWAQVMISRFMGWSPASGPVLTAQSLDPAPDSVSAPPPLTLCLTLSLKTKSMLKNINSFSFCSTFRRVSKFIIVLQTFFSNPMAHLAFLSAPCYVPCAPVGPPVSQGFRSSPVRVLISALFAFSCGTRSAPALLPSGLVSVSHSSVRQPSAVCHTAEEQLGALWRAGVFQGGLLFRVMGLGCSAFFRGSQRAVSR